MLKAINHPLGTEYDDLGEVPRIYLYALLAVLLVGLRGLPGTAEDYIDEIMRASIKDGETEDENPDTS